MPLQVTALAGLWHAAKLAYCNLQLPCMDSASTIPSHNYAEAVLVVLTRSGIPQYRPRPFRAAQNATDPCSFTQGILRGTLLLNSCPCYAPRIPHRRALQGKGR